MSLIEELEEMADEYAKAILGSKPLCVGLRPGNDIFWRAKDAGNGFGMVIDGKVHKITHMDPLPPEALA